MATLPWLDAFVSINSVDLSDHARKVTLDFSAEQLDETAMSHFTRRNKAGLYVWSLSIEFNQDFAAAKVDATLQPLVGAAAFTIIIRPVAASAVGATNPNYTGSATLEKYGPVDGSVGQLAIVKAEFRCAGTLSRATS